MARSIKKGPYVVDSLDLEDAVGVAEKADARQMIAEAVQAKGFGRRELARKPILMLLESSGVVIGRARQSISARLADAAVARLLDALGDVPVHIHVAEQTAEVDDCLRAHGQRPIEWLAAHAALDARWQLVHATHAARAEIEAVARSGAGVVICPSTEANLGDGLADIPGWLQAGVPLPLVVLR